LTTCRYSIGTRRSMRLLFRLIAALGAGWCGRRRGWARRRGLLVGQEVGVAQAVVIL
jgi:hypothetical protein